MYRSRSVFRRSHAVNYAIYNCNARDSYFPSEMLLVLLYIFLYYVQWQFSINYSKMKIYFFLKRIPRYLNIFISFSESKI